MISERLYEAVERGARLVAKDWQKVEWEDLRQDAFVRLLEKPTERAFYEETEDDKEMARLVRRMLRQIAAATYQGEMTARGQNHYSTKYVRALLKDGFLTDDLTGTLSEQWDLARGLKKVKSKYPDSYKVLVRRFVEDSYDGHSQYVTDAVDRLTRFMNRTWIAEVQSHEGPRTRKYGTPMEETIEHEHYYSNIN